MLHDVVEDTELTINDLREIYVECGFEKYFDIYIKHPLQCITHDKSVSYDEYIKICLMNPVSALVKMLDLQDNLYVVDLVDLSKEKYKRAVEYLTWIYIINNEYHFLEKTTAYKQAFEEENK